MLVIAGVLLSASSASALTTFHVRPTPGPGEFATLQAAYDAIGAADDYDIVIHEGTYNEVQVGEGDDEIWAKWFPGRTIRIIAAPGEYPVFDGQGGSRFVQARLRVNDYVRLHFEGLRVRNYSVAAIVLEGYLVGGICPYEVNTWNAGTTIRNNIFENIGDAATPTSSGNGFAAIMLISSRENLIEGNVFRDVWNRAPHENKIHAIYANYESHDNIIRGNFIEDSSGDPFKFRFGSVRNVVVNNYVHRGFYNAPGQQYRIDSAAPPDPAAPPVPDLALYEEHAGVSFFENLLLYPWASANDPQYDVFACMLNTSSYCGYNSSSAGWEPCPVCAPTSGDACWEADDYTTDRFIADDPTTMEVAAATALDRDGDGNAELVVAIEGGGVSRVLRSKLRPYYLGEVIWSSGDQRVLAMTSGDYDDDGVEELLLAVQDVNGVTEIWRGTGTAWIGALDLSAAPIYRSTNATVTAMTTGDYDGNGRDELLTAIRDLSGETRVYRGDGVTAYQGAVSGTPIYMHASWKIDAMATGDVDDDGRDDVITAFWNTWEDRVYVGNGTTGLTGKKLIFVSTTDHVTTLSAGDVDGSGRDDLITALRSSTTTRVWRGDGWDYYGGTGNGVQVTQLYGDYTWRVPDLVVGEFRAGNAAEVATAFWRWNAIQIWNGNGETGVTSYWKFFDESW